MGWCPWDTWVMQSLSTQIWVSAKPPTGTSWGESGKGIIPSVCLRVHRVPREESPWHIPSKGSVPPWGGG